MSEEKTIKGGCLCGQVRYTANAEPAFTGVCHCKNCQKQAGSAFSIVVAANIARAGVSAAFSNQRSTSPDSAMTVN